MLEYLVTAMLWSIIGLLAGVGSCQVIPNMHHRVQQFVKSHHIFREEE